mmetsp:Transcript_19625/g.47555  ORF Transcript_19625/g.47555 Transcript_19625/m.47555 type:complete len:546 (+) Transcript_19625:122-1759(+)
MSDVVPPTAAGYGREDTPSPSPAPVPLYPPPSNGIPLPPADRGTFVPHAKCQPRRTSHWIVSTGLREERRAGGDDLIKLANFKVELCEHWRRGRCNRGDACTYAHGRVELRGKRAKMCEWVNRDGSGCRYGESCHNAHSMEELEAWRSYEREGSRTSAPSDLTLQTPQYATPSAAPQMPKPPGWVSTTASSVYPQYPDTPNSPVSANPALCRTQPTYGTSSQEHLAHFMRRDSTGSSDNEDEQVAHTALKPFYRPPPPRPTTGPDAPFYKTKICEADRQGVCPRGAACSFAHGRLDLRGNATMCKYINPDGSGCRYGDSCHNAHTMEELEAWRARDRERSANVSTPPPVAIPSYTMQLPTQASTPEPVALRGKAALIVDGAYFCQTFSEHTRRQPRTSDVLSLVGMMRRKWAYDVSAYHSLYVSTNYKELRLGPEREALKQLHKDLKAEGFGVWESRLKPNGQQSGADCKITMELLDKARDDRVDVIFLVAGDSDFEPALDKIKTNEVYRKDVYLITWDSHFSRDLRSRVYDILLLDQVKWGDTG